MKSVHLHKLAIKEACACFISVRTIEDAETAVTREDMQNNILSQLDLKLTEKEKGAVTLNLLKAEMIRNNLFSTK